MNLRILIILLLFGVALDCFAQKNASKTSYLLSEAAYADSINRVNPDLDREEMIQLLRKFYRENFVKESTALQSGVQRQAAIAATSSAYDIVPDSLEYIALAAFYNGTKGISWYKRDNWMSGTTHTDFSTWYGVSVVNGDVTQITLDENNLKGALPVELGQLKALENLSLYRNSIGGTLPAELGELKKLVNIDLNSNDISGPIPPEIGNMSSLVTIEFGLNELTGKLPEEIGQLTNLKTLDLNGNTLLGPLPWQLGNLSNLEYLGGNSNNFIGPIPDELGNLTNLRTLAMGYTRLTGLPASLGNLSSLSTLYIPYSNLRGSLPSTFSQLKSLTQLFLNGNHLSGSISPSLGEMSKLQRMNLLYNALEGELPPELGNLVELQYLNLQYNRLEGAVPETIKNLTKLKSLNVSFNQISSFPDFSGVVHASNISVGLSFNQFESFKNFESNYTAAGTHIFRSFTYLNQKEVPLYLDGRTFSVDVGGSNNKYQWYKNNEPITGATQSFLTVENEEINVENHYHCQISNTLAKEATLVSLTTPQAVNRNIFYAIKDGNWHQPGTWSFEPEGHPSQSVPSSNAKVFIQDHHITVNGPASCQSIEVSVEQNAATLVVDGATLNMYSGNLELVKKQEGYPANVRIINGGKIQLNKDAIEY